MQDETNDQGVEEVVEEVEEEEAEEPAPETNDIETLKAQLAKQAERGIVQRERTRTLKDRIAKLEKALAAKEASKEEAPQKQTGELDDAQLDYLDLKGITEEDEIAVIQKVMERTGQTVRQALKDDYVQSKLEAIRKEKEVKNATPSGTKRASAGQENDLALAVSKFKQSGILPDDFKLKTAVVNYIAEESNANKPRWH